MVLLLWGPGLVVWLGLVAGHGLVVELGLVQEPVFTASTAASRQ